MRASELVEQPRWIVSARYDLTWFFGGALISVLVLGLYFAAAVPIVLLWWAWLLAFDGPHIGAAFTRTYLDAEEWRTRRRLLLVSLLSFAVGPIFLVFNLVTKSDQPFLLYLGAATLYGYHHVVRQHYGFMALYKARNRESDRLDFLFDKWFLYVGCWLPYFYLLVTHPNARRLLRLSGEVPRGSMQEGLSSILLLLWIAAFVAFLARQFMAREERLGRPAVRYAVLAVLLYGIVYFFVARYEPSYTKSQGPDQDFLLISILVTIFHNVQYIGLVWFYNRNRYSATDADFGPATAVNRTFLCYAGACLAFSGIVYFSFAASTGVFPAFQLFLKTKAGPFTANQLGLCLWWGLAVNHYYLDQKIWRIRGDAQLKRNLGL
jgi:hypothetical protein